ncbi:MAG: N-acetylglucosamine-6-phosphate deacetylase [Verrucomicrobiia bacterium]
MQIQEITGRFFSTGKPIAIKWRGKKIIEINEVRGKESIKDLPFIANLLFDLQINGFAGIDFQSRRKPISENSLLIAVEHILKSCCGHFFLTLITDRWDRMLDKLIHLKRIRDNNQVLKKAIAGWHIEGPFLSEKPGFYGAHNPRYMIDPSPAHIRQIRDIIPDDRILLTIAPERKGAIKAIETATQHKIVVFIGHSDAPTSILREAIKAGAKGFTHLGNGCPQLLDRKDNILWRILDLDFDDSFKISLIPDSIHISPPLFRLIHKVLPRKQIIYVSDAVAGAGAPKGIYSLGEMKITVEQDGTIWNESRTGYAGSSLCPIDGILRAMKMLDCEWQQVWENYSTVPASVFNMGVEMLKPGMDADFVLLKSEKEGTLKPLKCVVSGKTYTTNEI